MTLSIFVGKRWFMSISIPLDLARVGFQIHGACTCLPPIGSPSVPLCWGRFVFIHTSIIKMIIRCVEMTVIAVSYGDAML